MPDAFQPSDFELSILRVLWRLGPATVRDIHEELLKERQLGYTTVLKTMQIMVDKGLLKRDESRRSHVYRPSHREEETQAGMVRNLLKKVFGGSTQKLMLAALKESRLKPGEEDEIKAMLAQARKEKGK